MNAKRWLIGWIVITIILFSVAGYWVYEVDPYFHYHKPNTDKYYYVLDNQRSQNDGICKHFYYDTLVTGTSMTENFKTSEVNELFNCTSVKASYSGASFKEINDNVEKALEANENLKTVIRCLDITRFCDPWDMMSTDLGIFPTWLYDNNPFNDIKYLLNREVIFNRVYEMIYESSQEGFTPGITSFDDYSSWQDEAYFGIETVCGNADFETKDKEQIHIGDYTQSIIKENIEKNVTSIADKYPKVDFYYYYPPYSALAWYAFKNDGVIYKYLEAEKYITELIIEHENIHLFSFNNRYDITTDLNNYSDYYHYASWINSLILKWMKDGEYQLTKDNYRDYLEKEQNFYTSFDFESIKNQRDYEANYYAAALLNNELTGVQPMEINNGYQVNLDDGYNYLVLSTKNGLDNDHISVCFRDSLGKAIFEENIEYSNGNRQDEYVIDLTCIDGNVRVYYYGNSIDNVFLY